MTNAALLPFCMSSPLSAVDPLWNWNIFVVSAETHIAKAKCSYNITVYHTDMSVLSTRTESKLIMQVAKSHILLTGISTIKIAKLLEMCY